MYGRSHSEPRDEEERNRLHKDQWDMSGHPFQFLPLWPSKVLEHNHDDHNDNDYRDNKDLNTQNNEFSDRTA